MLTFINIFSGHITKQLKHYQNRSIRAKPINLKYTIILFKPNFTQQNQFIKYGMSIQFNSMLLTLASFLVQIHVPDHMNHIKLVDYVSHDQHLPGFILVVNYTTV